MKQITDETVYNIGKIKEDVPSSAKLIAVAGSQALDGPSSTDIIRNKNDFVNNNSLNESYSSDTLNTDYLKIVENGNMETAQWSSNKKWRTCPLKNSSPNCFPSRRVPS